MSTTTVQFSKKELEIIKKVISEWAYVPRLYSPVVAIIRMTRY